ncbi:AAA family ATPase [Candidatus Thorarchaeota archaeon]|nr:MAG: AAA family ATPase [Candidatus Thorarchaeota archaeon]
MHSEGILCFHLLLRKATKWGSVLSREEIYTEVIDLVEPEDLPSRELSQQSVVEDAIKLKNEIEKAKENQSQLEKLGLKFGGKTLLIGPPGTDFMSFIHHISTDIPLRLLRFRFEGILESPDRLPENIRTGFEFAKRNSPALLYIERFELLAENNSNQAAVLSMEMKNCSWDVDEVLVICQTSNPKAIDRNALTLFEQTYVFQSPTLEDRVRVLEKALAGSSADPTLIAEVTEGWAFSDITHLASFLVRNPLDEKSDYSKSELERIIGDAGIVPLGRKQVIDSIAQKVEGGSHPTYERLSEEYPDAFLDQLYLMAVGDNFHRTQQVIETLNSNLPLTPEDREFLSYYPFLLSGSADEKLTRLLRAKRSKDRLDRLLGR